MATGAIEDISEELKTQYPPGSFEEPVNLAAPYREKMAKLDLVASEGNTAVVPLGLKRAWNVGSVADIGAMPTPIDPTRIQGTVSPELFVGSFQIGIKTKAMAKSKKSTFSLGGTLADRTENTLADLGKYINRVYAGSNRGSLATVLTNDGSNTLTLDKPMITRLLDPNMRIDVYDAVTGGSARAATNRKLTSVDKVSGGTNQIVYDGADDATIAAGDAVFITGTYGRTHWSLRDLVDDGTDTLSPFSKSRNTYPDLKSIVKYGSDGLRDLSEQLILDIIAEIADLTGQYVTRALANTGQARKYVEFIQPERRYPGPTGSAPKYTVGYDDTSLQIIAPGVNCRLESDTDILPRTIFFLVWDKFGRYEGMPLDWIDEGELLRMIPTSGGHNAGFLAYVGAIENQVCTMLKAQGRLADLNDPICGDSSNPV